LHDGKSQYDKMSIRAKDLMPAADQHVRPSNRPEGIEIMRYLLIAVSMLVFVSPASASLQIISPSPNSMNSSFNDFADDLDDLTPALVKVVAGDVKVLAAGTLSFFAHASESGFTNTFHIFDTSSNEYTYEEHELAWNEAGVPIVSFGVPANTLLSQLLASFTTDGSNGIDASINEPNNPGFGIFVASDEGYDPNHLYFGYDDNGAGPDDNHDDLIVSVVWSKPLGGTPGTVPEPVSFVVWGMLAAAAVVVVPAISRRR
jgi:hypothetical protein